MPAARVTMVSKGRMVGDHETVASANLVNGSGGFLSRAPASFSASNIDSDLNVVAEVCVVVRAPEIAAVPSVPEVGHFGCVSSLSALPNRGSFITGLVRGGLALSLL